MELTSYSEVCLSHRHGSATYRFRVDNATGAGRGVRTVTHDGQSVPAGTRTHKDDGRPHDVRCTPGNRGDSAMADPAPTDEALATLQWTTLDYYLKESNWQNGLIRDKTDPAAPASIAAVGMGLAAIPILVERGV